MRGLVARVGTLTADSAVMNATIGGNVVNNIDGVGIYFLANSNGTLNAKVENNTAGPPLSGSRPGIRIDSGSSAGAAVDTSVCLLTSGNTATGIGGTFDGIAVRKQGTAATTNDFGIVGLSPSPADATQTTNVIRSQNPADVPAATAVVGGSNFISCSLGF
jgi:large repetitive protein